MSFWPDRGYDGGIKHILKGKCVGGRVCIDVSCPFFAVMPSATSDGYFDESIQRSSLQAAKGKCWAKLIGSRDDDRLTKLLFICSSYAFYMLFAWTENNPVHEHRGYEVGSSFTRKEKSSTTEGATSLICKVFV